ncbi:MAG: 4-diphosphocytidyl-2-C-methyl-D-erythritol kinase [uncultured Acidimicrobiales bacterium]|uniref:4-diphosphocytidyl-2-C-methyl-D-erythritol kinase n=1 Tax=uncultured Acidimicrobiales bacterium TaxID=310071 RepID=A0A6J4JG96_9ACTN|nr:MAG: 4-diphosphocytidyl-2-C-methyl-D-erythritol kinase [uncultured Acidimicrobiales bacterium]
MHVERAPAKLTVSLRITGVRADGYHLIDAEMVTLDYGDVLEIGDGDDLEIVGPYAAGVPADDENLVRRALALTGRRASVRLNKQVPAGAGMGGGSADAAAILRWAGCSDPSVAVGLGADVAFCMVGGRARVRGVGEVVEPLPYVSRTFTLLVPPVPVSTPLVYRAWDELGGPAASDGSLNDLEAPALLVAPELGEWRDRLARVSGRRPQLAGSGGTWFVEGEFPGEGRIVARTVRALEVG